MPLTEHDELWCHQIVSTFDHVDQSDLQWAEHLVLEVYDTEGKIYISTGFGKYTNRNVMDAYGGVRVGKTQHMVWASRELRSDINSYRVGPFSYEIVEPLKRIRVCLGKNDQDVSLDLQFEASSPAMEESPHVFFRSRGRMINDQVRYYQFGQVIGQVTVGGQTYKVGKDDAWWSVRDHSWGIRSWAGDYVPEKGKVEGIPGVQPPLRGENLRFDFGCLDLKNYAINYTKLETLTGEPVHLMSTGLLYPLGDPRKPLKVTDVKHYNEYAPRTRNLVNSKVVITTGDGVTREVLIKPLGVFYTRADGYKGYANWVHGKWMGPNWIDGRKLDLTDGSVLEELHGMDTFSCECRCGSDVGYGIVNCSEPMGGWEQWGNV